MTLYRQFLEFHKANPSIYRRIVEICDFLHRSGYNHYSMATILHVLRYEHDTAGDVLRHSRHAFEPVQTTEGVKRVKMNNNHAPYYARLVMQEFPRFRGMFDLRRCKILNEEPNGLYTS